MGEWADYWGPGNPLNRDGEPCAGCGLVARGRAFLNNTRYCHGDGDPSPTCYEKAVREQTTAANDWVPATDPFEYEAPPYGDQGGQR